MKFIECTSGTEECCLKCREWIWDLSKTSLSPFETHEYVNLSDSENIWVSSAGFHSITQRRFSSSCGWCFLNSAVLTTFSLRSSIPKDNSCANHSTSSTEISPTFSRVSLTHQLNYCQMIFFFGGPLRSKIRLMDVYWWENDNDHANNRRYGIMIEGGIDMFSLFVCPAWCLQCRVCCVCRASGG